MGDFAPVSKGKHEQSLSISCAQAVQAFHSLPQNPCRSHILRTRFFLRNNELSTPLRARHLSSSQTPPNPRPRLQSRKEVYAARNRSLFMYTSAVIVFFSGMTYAAVPLYRLFCSSTGFAGTPQVGIGKFDPERLVPVEEARRIKVHFNADRSDQLPWTFVPEQKFVSVLPGETSLAFYKARNTSPQDVIGIATYNVTPDRVSFSPPNGTHLGC